MRQKTSILSMVIFFIFLFVLPSVSFAETADTVVNIRVCAEDVLIEMYNAGWLVVREDDVGEENLDDIMSLALKLLESEIQTGYFDPGDPISTCEMEYVRPITTLEPLEQEN